MNAVLTHSVAGAQQVMTLPLPSPTDFLKGVPEAFRDALLCELLRMKTLAEPECAVFPVVDTNGQPFGLFLHSESATAADAMYAQLDSVTRTHMMKPYVDLDWNDCLTDEQLDTLTREPSLQRQ